MRTIPDRTRHNSYNTFNNTTTTAKKIKKQRDKPVASFVQCRADTDCGSYASLSAYMSIYIYGALFSVLNKSKVTQVMLPFTLALVRLCMPTHGNSSEQKNDRKPPSTPPASGQAICLLTISQHVSWVALNSSGWTHSLCAVRWSSLR